MDGARGVLINITGGPAMTLFEVDEAANRIREEVDPDANILSGSTFDEKMQGRLRVSDVAHGLDANVDASGTPLLFGSQEDRREGKEGASTFNTRWTSAYK